jgi:transaldolase
MKQIEKQSLCWATTGSICVVRTIARWDVDAIELLSKYGLTPQLEIWQKVGGSLTAAGFQAVAPLSPSIPCAVTAIYSASQAVVSAVVGAKCAIAYVNRATRLLGDGFALVRDMANVLQRTNTEILAASIKSPEEAVKTLLAGAHHLTLPFHVLQAIAVHELSQQTVDEFANNGRGISY